MITSLRVFTAAGVVFFFSLLPVSPLRAEEQKATGVLQPNESYDVSLTLFDAENVLDWFDFPCSNEKRVVIMDEHGNKIREERLQEDQAFCTSTLAPMIYKCSFVTEACGVHYYLLRKN